MGKNVYSSAGQQWLIPLIPVLRRRISVNSRPARSTKVSSRTGRTVTQRNPALEGGTVLGAVNVAQSIGGTCVWQAQNPDYIPRTAQTGLGGTYLSSQSFGGGGRKIRNLIVQNLATNSVGGQPGLHKILFSNKHSKYLPSPPCPLCPPKSLSLFS